jgi:hypothetical protein
MVLWYDRLRWFYGMIGYDDRKGVMGYDDRKSVIGYDDRNRLRLS